MAKKKTAEKTVHQVKMPKDHDYEILAPESLDEVATLISRIAEEQRVIDAIDLKLNDKVAAAQLKAMEEALPHSEAIAGLVRGVFMFAEANRKELTADGRKTVQVPTGSFGWRFNPPSVQISRKVTVEKMEERLKALKLERFLRYKPEVNKEAMLSEQSVAATVPGVKIKQDEIFTIKPDALEVGVEAEVDDLRVVRK